MKESIQGEILEAHTVEVNDAQTEASCSAEYTYETSEFVNPEVLPTEEEQSKARMAQKTKGTIQMAAGAALVVVGVPMLVLPGPGALAILGGAALASRGHRNFTRRRATPVEEKLDFATSEVAEATKKQAKQTAEKVAAEAPKVAERVKEEAPKVAAKVATEAGRVAQRVVDEAPKVARSVADNAPKVAEEVRKKAPVVAEAVVDNVSKGVSAGARWVQNAAAKMVDKDKHNNH